MVSNIYIPTLNSSDSFTNSVPTNYHILFPFYHSFRSVMAVKTVLMAVTRGQFASEAFQSIVSGVNGDNAMQKFK